MPQFIVPEGVQVGMRIELSSDEAHHVRNVFRLKRGDTLQLFDGKGHRFEGRIDEMGIKKVFVILEKELPSTESRQKITLYQGVLKGDKMDWVVQKGAELGVTSLQPFLSAHSVVRDVSKNKIARWQSVGDAALKQCGRSIAMKVSPPISLEEILQSVSPPLLLLWEGSHGILLREVLMTMIDSPEIGLLAGPEGGFSEEEIAKARQRGYTITSLGSTILKSETASVSALAVIQYALKNLG